ncbi:MAG: DUF262 domain-containing protein [Muribaculaceae bacterium]|nr:DUF262 domain-containing protein [Muribaculaceae bacterium]
MARKKLTEDEIVAIDNEIQTASIPYDYDTKEYPTEVIIQKYLKDQIFVPTYQRKFVWTPKQRSRFIESVFLGVPIMPFLVSISGEEAELEIIDGSQRIRTLVEYCANNLKLVGLEKLSSLNGTTFNDLSKNRQNKFLLRDFRFHVVTDRATPDIRADIFNRVNTSSNKLSPSETRKGVYQSEFYDFIIECAKDQLFREVCPIPKSKIDRGEYEELVLRFFAYSESYLKFKHDVSPFLDAFVKKHQTSFDRERLKSNFYKVMQYAKTYLPVPYFARIGRENATPRVRFEALSVGIYLALEQNADLGNINLDWLNSNEFKKLTTSDASNNPGRLKARIEFVRDCLLGVQKELTYEDDKS